eukprot:2179514-Karenia_brevis.AAC.1
MHQRLACITLGDLPDFLEAVATRQPRTCTWWRLALSRRLAHSGDLPTPQATCPQGLRWRGP